MFLSASRSISLDTKKVFWGGLHCSGLTAWWYVACWDPSCDAEESESFTTLFFPTVQCTTTRALSSIGQLPWWTVNYFWMVFSHKQNKKCRWYFAKYFLIGLKKICKNLRQQKLTYTVPKEINCPRYNMKGSGENLILRGIFHVVSCFPLHFV